MSSLINSTYNPTRGGHAPGDVRDAFLEAINAYANWEDETPEPCITVRGQKLFISTVCGLVWNCTDIMPGAACQQIQDLLPWLEEFPANGASYAQGARRLLWMTDRAQQVA